MPSNPSDPDSTKATPMGKPMEPPHPAVQSRKLSLTLILSSLAAIVIVLFVLANL